MSWKVIMKIFLFFVSIATLALLITASYSGDNRFFQQQALAQPSDTTANNTASSPTENGANANTTSVPGQSVFYRGIEASKEPVHLNLPQGMEPQSVNILPHRDDGASYSGVLTFTATDPVDVGIGHRLPVDNSTLSQIDSEELGDLFTVSHNDKSELGVPGIITAGSIITPDYGVSPPYFSASIPFVGSSLWLSTPDGEPFVAVYEVNADIFKPQSIVDLDGLSISTNTTATNSP
jgi:hypothetical protein